MKSATVRPKVFFVFVFFMHTLGYAYILSDGDFFISTVLYVRTVQPDLSNHTYNVHNFALH